MQWIQIAALAGALTLANPNAPGAAMRLNEVLADPPPGAAGDANGDGRRDSSEDEFVEIVNMGTVPVDIAGWSLGDSASVRHRFPDAPPIPVQPGGVVTVFGGGTPTGIAGLVYVASSGRLMLNNGGDRVLLCDRSGAGEDSLVYGAEGGRDLSMVRVPDGWGDWKLAGEEGTLAPFSPGRWNSGLTPLAPRTWGGVKRELALPGR